MPFQFDAGVEMFEGEEESERVDGVLELVLGLERSSSRTSCET